MCDWAIIFQHLSTPVKNCVNTDPIMNDRRMVGGKRAISIFSHPITLFHQCAQIQWPAKLIYCGIRFSPSFTSLKIIEILLSYSELNCLSSAPSLTDFLPYIYDHAFLNIHVALIDGWPWPDACCTCPLCLDECRKITRNLYHMSTCSYPRSRAAPLSASLPMSIMGRPLGLPSISTGQPTDRPAVTAVFNGAHKLFPGIC